ncbi:protein kinase [Nonomuraea sp. B10E15]|uniref:caspase, EACC1-associated type n=1 Tax=Nonomuraea sp. B10E15 TaxID=3153560 RepID=UPI00325F3A4F
MRLDPVAAWQDSRAILIGVSAYRDERLPKIVAAANSLQQLNGVITSPHLCGWPADRVTVLSDPSDSRTVAMQIRQFAQETRDVLLLYYVGHGTLTPHGELCLSVTDTDADNPDLTGVEYNRIRSALRDSPARVKMVILDCCYSGRAIKTLINQATVVADTTEIAGTYTLTASDLAAHVPPPEEQADACTSFTDELVNLIRTGIPDKGNPLTLGTLYIELRRRLRARGLPDPNQRGTDTAHSFAFTRNAATSQPAVTALKAISPSTALTHQPMQTSLNRETRLGRIPDKSPVKPNALYKLSRVPLGEGTFSQVFLAAHRTTGDQVALKRARANKNARARIQREIEVQLLLAPHPHIMPIIDYDPGLHWYTMPVAKGTLKDLRDGLNEDDLASIITDLSWALEAAHEQELVHRDISPMNILALENGPTRQYQWVLADWGMVRRPYGTNSARLTRTGASAGTPGFDAPELANDAQNASAAADVYSLGRVAAWFLTKKFPSSGQPLLPEGPELHWRMFVKSCTENDLSDRLASMPEIREALANVFILQEDPPALRIQRLLDDTIKGYTGLKDLMQFAQAYSSDAEIYIDHVARVPTGKLREWSVEHPSLASEIAIHMAQHVRTSQWGDRDREYVAIPLMFILTILQSLTDAHHFAHAMDVATSYFAADALWACAHQRDRTVQWLLDLNAPADTVIARALTSQLNLVDYYRPGMTPRSLALRAIFNV